MGLILLGIVFYPMLAFGDYKYLGPAVLPHWAFVFNSDCEIN